MKKVKNAINIEGKSVWIMPEGTRSKGRGILPFKKGAFHTAVRAQCPVVPIAISSWEKGVNLTKLTGSRILVKFCDPIETKGMTSSEVGRLKDRCEQIVREEVAKLDEKLS